MSGGSKWSTLELSKQLYKKVDLTTDFLAFEDTKAAHTHDAISTDFSHSRHLRQAVGAHSVWQPLAVFLANSCAHEVTIKNVKVLEIFSF